MIWEMLIQTVLDWPTDCLLGDDFQVGKTDNSELYIRGSVAV